MKRKKVALVINYDYHDYGGMLQAFATQEALTKLGVDSEAINYDNLKADINKRKWKYFLSNVSDWSILKEKGKVIGKKLRVKTDTVFCNNILKRDAAFDAFCRSKFKVSKAYESWKNLTVGCRAYDAVIVGSDQLWLPSNVAGDYYTLNFVPDNIKKIAYATSFGICVIPEKMKTTYSRFLKRIDWLSTREASGQDIIKDCIGREVPMVCDPTMLLEKDDWDGIATPNRLIEDDYIFCYFMGDNPEQREFVTRLANKENCKIVGLLHLDQYIPSDEKYVDNAPYDISPADFVSLVKNAKFVCTDSFHGTVFSIIFSKDFFTFKRFNKKASLSTNTRLTSLLNRLGLNNRLFSGDESVEEDLTIHDYDKIQETLKSFRVESCNYLRNSIQ